MKRLFLIVAVIVTLQGCAYIMQVDNLVIPTERQNPIFSEPKQRSI